MNHFYMIVYDFETLLKTSPSAEDFEDFELDCSRVVFIYKFELLETGQIRCLQYDGKEYGWYPIDHRPLASGKFEFTHKKEKVKRSTKRNLK